MTIAVKTPVNHLGFLAGAEICQKIEIEDNDGKAIVLLDLDDSLEIKDQIFSLMQTKEMEIGSCYEGDYLLQTDKFTFSNDQKASVDVSTYSYPKLIDTLNRGIQVLQAYSQCQTCNAPHG